MRTLRYFAAVAFFFAAISSSDAQRLVILHTNDTHSQIETVRVGDDKGLGGVERRLQFIDSIRTKYGKNRVLLLDAGDYDQGTPYYTLGHGDLEVDLNNALGYDVVTLGNHEFDDGQADLLRRLKKAKYKVVTCNYDFSKTCLARKVKPYTIVRRGGMKIGIIGTTSYLETTVHASSLEGMKRLDGIEEVNKWAALLRHKKHCDLVILLSHFGLYKEVEGTVDDQAMAAASRDIDIIIGGHTHTYLEHPVEVKNLDGKIVPIVQVGSKGIAVGMFEIE